MGSHAFGQAEAMPPAPSLSLVLDAAMKEYDAKPYETSAPFSFSVTNRWTNDITINNVKPSCGCTTVSLPPLPWTLHPGEGGTVGAKINLAGKMGTVVKTVSIYTSVGLRVASLKVVIPAPGEDNRMSAEQRQAALARAAADPRAIFHGDCARCHVDKGERAMGEALYVADCAICHESPHRESIVPDLHALKEATDLVFWKNIIAHGKPHSLMPAFGMSEGGPLSEPQVASLAAYLNRVIPRQALAQVMTNAAVLREARLAAQP